MKIEGLVRDALYNTSPRSGAEVSYARGVVLGVLSTIMAYENVGFWPALETTVANLPDDYRLSAIPEGWREDVKTIWRELKKEKKAHGSTS